MTIPTAKPPPAATTKTIDEARPAPSECPPTTSGVSKETLLGIEYDPPTALAELQAQGYDTAPLPNRLLFELARWAANMRRRAEQGEPVSSYAEHLRASGLLPSNPEVTCALLSLALECALAEDVGDSSVEESAGITVAVYDAWLEAVPPHPFSEHELDVAQEVHTSLVGAEGDVEPRMVHAVLAHDINAESIVRDHLGTMSVEDISNTLSKLKQQYPEAPWVRTIARDLPSFATRGDREDPAAMAAMARAMEELGELSREQVQAALGQKGM